MEGQTIRIDRRVLRLIPVALLVATLGVQTPAGATRPDIVVAKVDFTYLLSDVSLNPCSFPVLVREVGTQIYGTFVDSSTNVRSYTVHGAEKVIFTNLDTGQEVITGNAGQITSFPAVATSGPKGTTTLTWSDSFAGLNLKTANGETVIAGHGTADYVLVFVRQFKLLSFSIEEENTPLFEHSSDTICKLLTPAV